jgi:hypothetical protein
VVYVLLIVSNLATYELYRALPLGCQNLLDLRGTVDGSDTFCLVVTLHYNAVDLYGFIMHKCVHPNAPYFYHKGNLATEKYEKIRMWKKLGLRDYNA